ncbi:MAG: protein kinase [Candidatus Aminicenantes bacterium]|nr:protein kinase [Candidatus Aminicenantes bacterium]
MSIKCPKCHFDNPDKTVFCGKCAASLPAPGDRGSSTETVRTVVLKELATGSTFAGRYQVIEELGRGGMGRVYKVFDERIKEKVALKLLKPEISADEASIERFSNELRFARKIAHRHVCRMFDLGEDDGARYITMEYVPGEDLKSVLRMMGQMSAGKAVLVARQVCEGLAEAHRLGVVHRDLKPQNIMIDREGNVRIMDFGIARSLKVKGMTGAGVVIGTPEYMSPEQIEGQEVDGRSDIYSLGIILYEMMTGRVPFEGESFLGIAVKQKTEPPRNPREINPQIPDDLVRLILRCLEKDKAKRYQSAQDLLSELGKIEKGIPTTEKVLPSVKPSTSREITVKLNPRKLVIPAAALAVLVVAAIFALRLLPRKSVPAASTGKPSLAVMRFDNNTGDAGLDHWRKALPELLITDLSQSKYVNVLASDRLFDILSRLNQLEAGSYSSKALREVAVQGGVNHILLGQLTKAGDSFRLSYTLKAFGTGETAGSGWVAGQGIESFYTMVDAMTLKVKEDLKLTRTEISGDVDAELGRITTSSPETFLLYVEGREAHIKGDNARSIELMKKAVAIDPGFAMAYRSMAMSYNNSYFFDESRRCLEKALSLSDRISLKERLLLEADYYLRSDRTAPKGIEALNKFLEAYPGDSFANIKLAYTYLVFEMWDKAIEHSLVAVRNKDKTYYAYSYLSTAYHALGRPDMARDVIDGYFRNIGESGPLHADLADYYLYLGKYNEALEEIDKAIALSPGTALNYIYKGNLFLYQGDLIRAAEENKKLLELKDPMAQGYYLYNSIALAILQGKFNEAGTLSEQAVQALEKLNEKETAVAFRILSAYCLWRSGHSAEAVQENEKSRNAAAAVDNLSLQILALHRKGLAYCAMNSPGEARRAADELSALIRQGMNKNETIRVDHLLGSIELQTGNTGAAIELLTRAVRGLAHENSSVSDEQALYFETLAGAYFKAGDLAKARKEYEKIAALTIGRHRFGDIYARSFYMLGKIAEQEGENTKAREYYRKFLDLWKDADPGLPEVADARKRLAEL